MIPSSYNRLQANSNVNDSDTRGKPLMESHSIHSNTSTATSVRATANRVISRAGNGKHGRLGGESIEETNEIHRISHEMQQRCTENLNNVTGTDNLEKEKQKNKATSVNTSVDGPFVMGIDTYCEVDPRDDTAARMYCGYVYNEMKELGRSEQDVTQMVWKIKLSGTLTGKWLKSPTLIPSVTPFRCAVKMNEVIASDFLSASKKYSVFGNEHSWMDLAAVVEQLSAAMCAYGNLGVLESHQLSDSRPVRITQLQADSVNSTPCNSNVYIPRGIDNNLRPDVFCALVHAVAACGGSVVTDYVLVDPKTNKAVYTVVGGYALAMGVYDALRLLGGQYEACGAGDVFSLAFARGVTRVLSVVGHTDEGAWMRTVLRAGAFCVPYGGINVNTNMLTNIPCPLDGSIESWRNVVDSYALLVAAGVSEAAPIIRAQGKDVPFISVSKDVVQGDRSTYYSHIININMVAESFSHDYLRVLNTFFGLTSTSGLAAKFLVGCMNSRRAAEDRHLGYAAINPFFWIEPTCIIQDKIPGVSCRHEAVGAFVYSNEYKTEKIFGGLTYDEKSPLTYDITIPFTSIRGDPYLRWLAMRQKDGLAYIDLVVSDPNAFACTGSRFENVMQNGMVDEPVPLSTLSWVKGDNPTPKPHEGMYLGGGVVLQAQWISRVRSSSLAYGMGRTILPSPMSIEQGEATISTWCSNLMSMGIARLNVISGCVSRKVRGGMVALRDALLNRGINVTKSTHRRFVNADALSPEAAAALRARRADPTVSLGTSHQAKADNAMAGADRRPRDKLAHNVQETLYVPEVSRTLPRPTTVIGEDAPVVVTPTSDNTSSGAPPPEAGAQ